MSELTLELLQKLCNENKINWTLHAIKRIRERKIKMAEVISYIKYGIIIEDYPDDKPLHSCLICCKINSRYLHTVVSSDGNEVCIITAYIPNPEERDNNFELRKELL